MSLFNYDAYEKVFPPEAEKQTTVESAVDTFTPTSSEKATDDKLGNAEDLNADPTPEPKVEKTVIVTTEPVEIPKGEENG